MPSGTPCFLAASAICALAELRPGAGRGRGRARRKGRRHGASVASLLVFTVAPVAESVEPARSSCGARPAIAHRRPASRATGRPPASACWPGRPLPARSAPPGSAILTSTPSIRYPAERSSVDSVSRSRWMRLAVSPRPTSRSSCRAWSFTDMRMVTVPRPSGCSWMWITFTGEPNDWVSRESSQLGALRLSAAVARPPLATLSAICCATLAAGSGIDELRPSARSMPLGRAIAGVLSAVAAAASVPADRPSARQLARRFVPHRASRSWRHGGVRIDELRVDVRVGRCRLSRDIRAPIASRRAERAVAVDAPSAPPFHRGCRQHWR